MAAQPIVKPPRDAAYFSARSDAFSGKLLGYIGAPVTETNLQVLRAWQAVESGWTDNPRSGTALWNPWSDTKTSGQAGETRYNTAGVRNYPTADAGLSTMTATLLQYPGIVNGLRQSDPSAAINAIVNSGWVTSAPVGAYGAPGRVGSRDYTKSTLWQVYQKLSGGAGKPVKPGVGTVPVTGGVQSASFDTAGFGIPSGVGKFFSTLTSADFWTRFGYIFAGVLILVLGAILLFKDAAAGAVISTLTSKLKLGKKVPA